MEEYGVRYTMNQRWEKFPQIMVSCVEFINLAKISKTRIPIIKIENIFSRFLHFCIWKTTQRLKFQLRNGNGYRLTEVFKPNSSISALTLG